MKYKDTFRYYIHIVMHVKGKTIENITNKNKGKYREHYKKFLEKNSYHQKNYRKENHEYFNTYHKTYYHKNVNKKLSIN